VTGDPVVEIDLADPTPPYAQLRRGLAALIEQGTLAGGQHLPTVRQLAGDLGIAAGTVMRAYKELESAGYVRGERRRGTVVIPRERDPVDVDAALRALAVTYCHRAEDVGATPEQNADRGVPSAGRRPRGCGHPGQERFRVISLAGIAFDDRVLAVRRSGTSRSSSRCRSRSTPRHGRNIGDVWCLTTRDPGPLSNAPRLCAGQPTCRPTTFGPTLHAAISRATSSSIRALLIAIATVAA
jgi:GntR family transcriptional regulator